MDGEHLAFSRRLAHELRQGSAEPTDHQPRGLQEPVLPAAARADSCGHRGLWLRPGDTHAHIETQSGEVEPGLIQKGEAGFPGARGELLTLRIFGGNSSSPSLSH